MRKTGRGGRHKAPELLASLSSTALIDEHTTARDATAAIFDNFRDTARPHYTASTFRQRREDRRKEASKERAANVNTRVHMWEGASTVNLFCIN